MIPELWEQKRPIAVLGAAFGDILLNLPHLPESGQDIVGQETDRQIGGCAFNVARALGRLEISFLNGIPVGNGSCGQSVKLEMEKEGFPPILHDQNHDNGWCLAMVEPSKERTFITIEGCEQYWNAAQLDMLGELKNHLVYVSGYELVGAGCDPLKKWLLALDDTNTIFVDFGPRINELDSDFLQSLIDKKPIVTLNRDEVPLLLEKDNPTLDEIEIYCKEYQLTLIYRLDKEGAWVIPSNEPRVYVPSFQVDAIDTVGAGDSHCAGTLAGLACQFTLEHSVALGNAVAALVVGTEGAGNPPTRSEVLLFLS